MNILIKHIIGEIVIHSFFNTILSNFNKPEFLSACKLLIEVEFSNYEYQRQYFKDCGYDLVVVSTYEQDGDTIMECEVVITQNK